MVNKVACWFQGKSKLSRRKRKNFSSLLIRRKGRLVRGDEEQFYVHVTLSINVNRF